MKTEREFFNEKLKCGDLPRDSTIGYSPVFGGECGASDWCVIRPNLFKFNERALQCQKCGLWTQVELPDMPEMARKPNEKDGQ